MQRTLLAVAALVAVGLTALLIFDWDTPPPLPSTATPQSPAESGDPQLDAPVIAKSPRDASVRREVENAQPGTTPKAADLAGDQVYRAALSGLTGRIVHADGEPFEDVIVRLYRFDLASVLPPVSALLPGRAEEFEPEFEIGSTTTREDGQFRFELVEPRGLLALDLEDRGEEGARRIHIIQDVPGPSEARDIGDLVMDTGGILIGKVVGSDGKPLADALVRATDLPGAMLQFFPVERFDPSAGLIVSEGPFNVFDLPRWAIDQFDKLPIPSARTGPDGSYRVTGVTAGSNLVAVTHPRHVSNVMPAIVVQAGQEKDAGTTKLSEGEWAAGKILDTEGEPVAGAEVRVAAKSPFDAPVHLATRSVKTAADGRFEVPGFSASTVYAAARRDPSTEWVLSDATAILDDIEIRLEARSSVQFTITNLDRRTDPDDVIFEFLPEGDNLTRASFMGALGIGSGGARTGEVSFDADENLWSIAELEVGDYIATIDTPHGQARVPCSAPSTEPVAVTLTPKSSAEVIALDPNGQPLRNARVLAVFAESDDFMGQPPMQYPRTDREGKSVVSPLPEGPGTLKVTVEHPAYGRQSGRLEMPTSEPLTLQFETPGIIEGLVTEKGQAPQLGKWMVVANRSWDFEEIDGAGPSMPRMVRPDAEGKFRLTGLRPGPYELSLVNAIDALKTPGSIANLMTKLWAMDDATSVDVEVFAGKTTGGVVLEPKTPGVIIGPAARVTGSVTVNGRVITGVRVEARKWGSDRFRKAVEVQDNGRFDLGLVPAGNLNIEVKRADGMFSSGKDLESRQLKIEEGVDQDLEFDIMTSSLIVQAVLPDRSPASRVDVSLSGTQWRWEEADSNGLVEFEDLTVGTYQVRIETDGLKGSESVEVTSVGPARVTVPLRATIAVSGRIDWSRVERPTRIWMSLHRTRSTAEETALKTISTSNSELDVAPNKDTFTGEVQEPGTYQVSISARVDGDWIQLNNSTGEIQIHGPTTDLVIVPGPMPAPVEVQRSK